MAEKPIIVRLDRDLYYDGEEVTGDVTFHGVGLRPRLYKTVMIILWARYVEFDNGVTREAFTLHMLKMPVAQELEVLPGDTKVVPFQFIIPSNSPPTFTHRTGAVQWRVAVVHEAPMRKTCRAVASQAFRKGSLYFSTPGLLPTAQSEVILPASRHMLRAEASLSKDVYSTDEEIAVHVTVHEEETHKLPAVTSVKAKVVQFTRAHKGNFTSASTYKLCKATEGISDWQATHLADNKGCVVEKTFKLKPKLVDSPTRPKCAHQVVSAPSPRTPTARYVNVLAPTCKFMGRDGQEAGLTYAVKVEVRTPSGHDVVLHLPFVMQGEREEAARATQQQQQAHGTAVTDTTTTTPTDTMVEEALEKLAGFCNMDDELPAYEDVETLSTPSYTTLRRNSVDTVFASAMDPRNMPSNSSSSNNNSNNNNNVLTVPSDSLRPPSPTSLGAYLSRRRHSCVDLRPSALPPTYDDALGEAEAEDHHNSATANNSGTTSPSSVRSAPVPGAHNRGRRASLSVFVGGLLTREKHADLVDATPPGSPRAQPDSANGSARPRRRSSAVGVLLENPVSASANRAIRRLRAATHSGAAPGGLAAGHGAGAAQRRRSKGDVAADEDESPEEVFASFKARYMSNTPVAITLDSC